MDNSYKIIFTLAIVFMFGFAIFATVEIISDLGWRPFTFGVFSLYLAILMLGVGAIKGIWE